MFTTDHGIPFPRAKCSLYDPGIEVAHIVKWSGKAWSDGRVINELISNIDHLPTLLDILAIPIPDSVQGKSYLPLLEGTEYSARNAVFAEKTYHGYCDPMRCIRTHEYKLIANFSAAPSFEDPTESYHSKTITVHPENPPYAYHEPVELYDLTNDPLEFHNLAGDTAHKHVLRNLNKQLHQWMVDTEDPLLTEIPLPPMHKTVLDILLNH